MHLIHSTGCPLKASTQGSKVSDRKSALTRLNLANYHLITKRVVQQQLRSFVEPAPFRTTLILITFDKWF